MNQSLVGVVEQVLRHEHVRRLLGARHGLVGITREDFIDLNRQPREILELVSRSPGAGLGCTRDKLTPDTAERILAVFRKRDIRYFFYIGGNDSALTVRAIHRAAEDAGYELKAIHIPKTIDNDLLENDHTPGFGSAARFVALAFIGDNLDNRALPGIKINVLMGRDAGFVTAASVLARRREDDGPHLIYVPERPFVVDKFVNDTAEVLDRFGRAVIAVSEGIRDAHGRYWTEQISQHLEHDSFGHVQLSGSGSLADFLAGQLRVRLEKPWRIRADTFGYLQRSFPVAISPVDAWEARLVGQMAVIYSLDGSSGSGSVALTRLPGVTYASGTRLLPIDVVAPRTPPFTRVLSDEFINEAENNINGEYLPYVGPLVGELPGVGWFEQVMASENE